MRLAARLTVGVGVLIAVIAHVGSAPLLHGLLSLNAPAIVAALLLVGIATVAAAWRWQVIAIRLGVELRLATAVGMYYRSQFLNSVLPGGIVGDVHRAISAGSDAESIKKSARSVAIERTAGQVVQVVLALIVLAFFGAGFEGYLLVALIIGVAVLTVAVLVTAGVSARARRALLHELAELRAGLGSAKTTFQVAISSVIVTVGHVATFAIATAAVGLTVPPVQMLPLAFVVLLGASIPLNIGGWGPREGVAGWAFALAGLGSSAGVSASTLYGALALISIAPGALVTVSFAIRRHHANHARPGILPALTPTAKPTLVLAGTNQEKTQ
ncbi:MAG TPA: lysylphosphatidylglycerol synthase transmembrane domain-containing protein [Galbitalea sp.]